MYKEVLRRNIRKIHTTPMGLKRIAKNLNIKEKNALIYCKEKLLEEGCIVFKKGKNFYCTFDNIVITINSHSYTIITAHVLS